MSFNAPGKSGEILKSLSAVVNSGLTFSISWMGKTGRDRKATMNGRGQAHGTSGETDCQSLPAQPSRLRLLFIDNLRWTMIILVISMHAADTYSPLGNWYFEDKRPLSAAALIALAAWQMYLQSFFMGLLFVIAYFA